MAGPTDDQIFAHMAPEDEIFCGKCGNDTKTVEYDDYITHKCLVCDFEPSPPEEQ